MTTKKRDKVATWDDLVAEGKELGRQRNLRGSLEKFDQAYEISREFDAQDSRRGESAYYLAYAKYVSKKNSEAIDLFEEALSYMLKDPNQRKQCMSIHSILAAIHFGLNLLDRAEFHVRESIKLQSDPSEESWENVQLLASILVTLKKYVEAAPVLEKLINYQATISPAEVPKTITILAFVSKELGDEAAELRWKKEYLKVQEKLKKRDKTKEPLVESPLISDPITNFIEVASRNQAATMHNDPKRYSDIVKIDTRFRDSERNLTLCMIDLVEARNPDVPFKNLKVKDEEWLEIYFFMQAHSSFLSAVSIGMSAHGPGTYTLLRAALENAMYAFFVHNHQKRKRIWLDRNRDEEATKKVRNTFTIGEIKKEIRLANSSLGDRVAALYDVTIDEGAHPNVNAYLANSLQTNDEGELRLAVTYLNPNNLPIVLEHLVEVGEIVLSIFREIFPKHID